MNFKTYCTRLFKALFNINSSETSDISSKSDKDLNEKYIIPFRHDAWWGGGGSFITVNGSDSSDIKDIDSEESQKIAVSPREVIDELKSPPKNISLENIDDKIKILEDKKNLIEQKYAQREILCLLESLENRKKYNKKTKSGETFKEFFSRYDTTDDEKIDALLEKYELVMRPPDIFIPEFPDEAVEIMKQVGEKINELCGKKPRFFVIAPEKDFKKLDKKRDPILLTQSPFGFYYHILGAWDKEMLFLPEL